MVNVEGKLLLRCAERDAQCASSGLVLKEVSLILLWLMNTRRFRVWMDSCLADGEMQGAL